MKKLIAILALAFTASAVFAQTITVVPDSAILSVSARYAKRTMDKGNGSLSLQLYTASPYSMTFRTILASQIYCNAKASQDDYFRGYWDSSPDEIVNVMADIKNAPSEVFHFDSYESCLATVLEIEKKLDSKNNHYVTFELSRATHKVKSVTIRETEAP